MSASGSFGGCVVCWCIIRRARLRPQLQVHVRYHEITLRRRGKAHSGTGVRRATNWGLTGTRPCTRGPLWPFGAGGHSTVCIILCIILLWQYMCKYLPSLCVSARIYRCTYVGMYVWQYAVLVLVTSYPALILCRSFSFSR